MDAEIAAFKKESKHQHEELNNLITRKKNQCREIIGKNNSLLELMNMELQTLRLRFVNEEIDAPFMTESLGKNKETVCCCLTAKQDQFQDFSCSSKSFQDYWVVRNTADFYKKLKELKTREEQMGKCSCSCCHDCANCLFKEIKCFFGNSTSLALFYLTGLFLLYFLFLLIALPGMYLIRCCQSCRNVCYRQGTRTQLILQIYQKYTKDIPDIYLPEM